MAHFDRAIGSVGQTSNMGKEGTEITVDDRLVLGFHVKLLAADYMANAATDYVSAGIMFSNTQIWIGQQKATIKNAETIPALVRWLSGRAAQSDECGVAVGG